MSAQKLEAEKVMPNIFEYHDYRDYLKDLLFFIKVKKGFSIREVARRLDLSHGYLPLIVDRHRNLSKTNADRLVKMVELNKKEETYFYLLMELSDSKDSRGRIKAYENIKKMSQYKDSNVKEPVAFEYLNDWLNVAIREFAVSGQCYNKPKELKKIIPYKVTVRQIEKAIAFLKKENLIVEIEEGQLLATDRDISCLGGIYLMSLGNFHGKMLELAKKGIEVHKKEDRKQTGYTFSINQEDFDEVKRILDEAKEKIKKIEKKSEFQKDAVYHINLSAFPLIRKEAK